MSVKRTTSNGVANNRFSNLHADNTPIKDVPDAPVIVSALDVGTGRAYNNGAVTITATNPTGGPVDYYTATSTPGSFTSSTASPVTVTGLASNTSYTFSVTGTQTSTSRTSAATTTSSVLATTIPQAATIGTATAPGVTGYRADITFTPNGTGGKTVTYTATSNPGSITGTSSASPVTVYGLNADTAYTFTVTASNDNGSAAASTASNSVTPTRTNWMTYSPGYGQAYAISSDTSSNVYIGGNSSDARYTNASALIKLSPRGNFVTGYAINGGSTAVAFSIVTDSSNNMYIAGTFNRYTLSGGSGGTSCGYVMKLNSSLAIQWQSYMEDISSVTSSNKLGTTKHVRVDSSGNVFTGGWFYRSSSGGSGLNATGAVAKYTSGGALSWQRDVVGATVTGYGNQISTGDFKFDMLATTGDSIFYFALPQAKTACLFKYNTSGTLQWQRNLTSTPGNNYYLTPGAVKVDSLGNVYCVVENVDYTTKTGYLVVVKYNSSGVLQWQKQLSYYDSYDPPYTGGEPSNEIQIDGSGYLYYCTTIRTSGTLYGARGVAFKFDSSGNLQWQRYITDTGHPPGSPTAGYTDSAFVSSELIGTDICFGYITFNQALSENGFGLIKVPVDGSKASSTPISGFSDNYPPLKYFAADWVWGNGGLTDAAGTSSDAAGTALSTTGQSLMTISSNTSDVFYTVGF